ncbi:MAG: hypothetical protein NVS1B6_15830 [Steroidobacteraceae bacterium]
MTTDPTTPTTAEPDWLNGTTILTGRYRVKQGWMSANGQSHPVSVLQMLVCPTSGGRGYWVNAPTVPLEAPDAE